jgi:hypothetical protein
MRDAQMKPVYVFNLLKKVLKGCRFRSGKNIKSMMMQWFQWQQRDSLLLGSMSRCINASMPMETIFMASTLLPRIILKWVSFEQV